MNEDWYSKLSRKDKFWLIIALMIIAVGWRIAPYYARIAVKLDDLKWWLQWHLNL